MIPFVARRLHELIDRHTRRRKIGITESEINDVVTRAASFQLQIVHPREDIWRKTVDASEIQERALRLSAGEYSMS